ncbi:MAG: radical SAM protein, partial [Deltaproteobacteria bacterium]
MSEPVAAIAFSETQSLCPECLRPVSAIRFQHGSDVYLRKTCPEHGEFQVVLWRGDPSFSTWVREKIPWHPDNPATSVDRGCPFDCGLCPSHRQQTCTALIEVTTRCNLNCAFCFARSRGNKTPDLEMGEIRRMYEFLQSHAGTCNIQLSGGEPTVRDDLPEIAAMGRSMGFEFIQVNTNGLRLAADRAYAQQLKEAGVSSVFLQFDAATEKPHRTLRGTSLLQTKLDAIRVCEAHGIGVVLVPTIVPGVNDHELGHMVQLAIKYLPAVRGVHFQPVSYFGRYPKAPTDSDRITIPEILRGLEQQTGGRVTTDDFGPPGCENARCSFHGTFVVMPDGELKAFSREADRCSCSELRAEQGAENARRFVARQWAQPAKGSCCGKD